MTITSKSLFLVGAVLVILLCVLSIKLFPRRGKVIESWQTGNNTFAVRVKAQTERLSLPGLGGAYYVFESNTLGTDRWTEIFVFRHDAAVLIPRNQVSFVNDKIGYIYMGWMYGVTTDAGATWSVWNAERDLPGWKCCNYNLIQDVSVAPDGVGTMRLQPNPERPGEVTELHTKDFGRHWTGS